MPCPGSRCRLALRRPLLQKVSLLLVLDRPKYPPFSRLRAATSLVVAAALFAQFLDRVIIVTALPQMARDYHVATLDMSIGLTIYMLAVISAHEAVTRMQNEPA